MTQQERASRRHSIRKEVLSLRAAIPDAIRHAYSRLIEEQFFSYCQSPVQSIHSYISYRSEVDTSGIIKRLQKTGASISIPYLASRSSNEFINVSFESYDSLVEGPYDILQPHHPIPADIPSIEYAFVPLAAFDGFGNRLGYGKGYYDRFLSQLLTTTKKIGLAFSIQELDEIPIEAHDVKLDLIITEQGIITPSQQSH